MHCSENSRLQRQQTQLIAIIQGFMLEMDRNSGLQSAQFEVIFDFREIPPNFREIPPNFREIPPNSSGLKFLVAGAFFKPAQGLDAILAPNSGLPA